MNMALSISLIRMDRRLLAIVIGAFGSLIYMGGLKAEMRDPFISIIDTEKQKVVEQKAIDLSNVSLNGIIWNKARAVAIINEELVMAGDTWRDFSVEKIEKQSVTLRSGAKTYTLSLEDMQAPQEAEKPSRGLELSLPGLDIPGETGSDYDEEGE